MCVCLHVCERFVLGILEHVKRSVLLRRFIGIFSFELYFLQKECLQTGGTTFCEPLFVRFVLVSHTLPFVVRP